MSKHRKNKRVKVTVVTRPTHVGNDEDYHYEGHLESLVGINVTEALLHHDSHPDASMVLIPAAQAIAELFKANNLLGAYYWREVWNRQEPHGDNDHHNHFAIPFECCEVIQANAH